MSQEERQRRARTSGAAESPLTPLLLVLSLLGIAAVLAMSAMQWREARAARKEDSARVAKIESSVAALSTKLDEVGRKVASAAAAPKAGPDPNKVYTVQTAGAPAKGPADAVVTIAEFSDFQ